MLRMMRGLLFGSLLAALIAPSGAIAVEASTFAEAQALAARESKPVLIDFFAVW
jgi:hypothetical protein